MWPAHRLSYSLASARLPMYISYQLRFIGFSILVLLSLRAAYYRIFQAEIKGQTIFDARLSGALCAAIFYNTEKHFD